MTNSRRCAIGIFINIESFGRNVSVYTQAHASIRALQHDMVALKADNAQLESSLLDEKQESAQLMTKLNSEVSLYIHDLRNKFLPQ